VLTYQIPCKNIALKQNGLSATGWNEDLLAQEKSIEMIIFKP
jgi:hypothetical protein